MSDHVGPSGRISGHVSLAERLEVEAAIDAAFEPLRGRRAGVGAARVRAAVRWGRGSAPMPVRWSAAVARLSELGVAVGMSAFIFAASLGSLPVRDGAIPTTVSDAIVSEDVAVPRVTKPLEDERYIRWLKLDRPVPMQDGLDASVLPSRGRDASVLPSPGRTQDLEADLGGASLFLRSLLLTVR